MKIATFLSAGLLVAAIGLAAGCDRSYRIEVLQADDHRCNAPNCPGHALPGQRCSTHKCSHPNCPGHARALDTCAHFCDVPGCGGHRSADDRCF